LPTTPKGRRTRAQILGAARRVFGRRGYVTLRMAEVAEEAGVSLGALYRYFENKEDLFVHLVGDTHDALFNASRARSHDFATQPYQALLEANRGYLALYHANRDVLRALIEAATVDERFRDLWWRMRERHVQRFVEALDRAEGVVSMAGQPARLVAEAMTAMVEQCAYVWFAQEHLRDAPVSVDQAAQVVSGIWHRTFFGDAPADGQERDLG
jgi:AcrR family transcriptional regulator